MGKPHLLIVYFLTVQTLDALGQILFVLLDIVTNATIEQITADGAIYPLGAQSKRIRGVAVFLQRLGS